MTKILEKSKAEDLRRKGFSLKEISEKLSVGKGTVSSWCKNIPLSQTQAKRLKSKQKKKGIEALLRASKNKKIQYLRTTSEAHRKGRSDIGTITKRDLFMLGLALYWGEGYKKGNNELGFTNSDPAMIKFFIKWLYVIYNIPSKDLTLRVSINQIHKERAHEVLVYWTKITKISEKQFTKTSFIKAKVKKIYPKKDQHFGTLRVKVKNGSALRSRILGSIEVF